MAKKNFLLGKGERLTESVTIQSGGGPKAHPYTFFEAKSRLQPMLGAIIQNIEKLPLNACPDDLVIAKMTLNPEYIAKSYYPGELLRSIGLEVVGSRSRNITPEKRSRDRTPEETTTTELFVKGRRISFKRWAQEMPRWNERTPGVKQIVEIENLSFPEPSSKIKGLSTCMQNTVFEVVLHLTEEQSEERYLTLFKQYLYKKGIKALFERRFYAGGLCFIEIEAPSNEAEYIAQFSLIRVLRVMPPLRLISPIMRSHSTGNPIELPNSDPVDISIKAAIFDGGIPLGHAISRWATLYEISDMKPAVSELLEHGVSVTSAFLFGHIDPNKPLPKPYSFVDHYRVLDDSPGQNPFELYEVLNRISDVLATTDYDFINLSLGPCLPIEDDEVHAWTAVLDEYFSKGLTLATIAVGNNGNADPSINANRVQVPSDCVNALSIGACDSSGNIWQRANYSSIGPGRSPGLIKPDLVEFGGSATTPFLTLDPNDGTKLFQTGGTSFAAPSALRQGVGIRAHFGNSLSSLAIRTLLVHCSENADIPNYEIGWGRIARDLNDVVICSNNMVRVVFQGRITASKYVRAPIPIPSGTLQGTVKIKATLCYVTSVDPHHPDCYTKSGLEVTFRPHKDRKRTVADGESEPTHAVSKPFFRESQQPFETEAELRKDSWKWENCIHAEKNFRGTSLLEPAFDIHYNARSEGHDDSQGQELLYALVITVEATRISDLYDQVVRKYATQLEQLVPNIEIPLKV